MESMTPEQAQESLGLNRPVVGHLPGPIMPKNPNGMSYDAYRRTRGY